MAAKSTGPQIGIVTEGQMSSKGIVKKPVTRPVRYSIASRVNFNLKVTLRKGSAGTDEFILAPRARTKKEFRDGDILSVEGQSLQQAVAMGYVIIVR